MKGSLRGESRASACDEPPEAIRGVQRLAGCSVSLRRSIRRGRLQRGRSAHRPHGRAAPFRESWRRSTVRPASGHD